MSNSSIAHVYIFALAAKHNSAKVWSGTTVFWGRFGLGRLPHTKVLLFVMVISELAEVAHSTNKKICVHVQCATTPGLVHPLRSTPRNLSIRLAPRQLDDGTTTKLRATVAT